jgi:hypothetical protein
MNINKLYWFLIFFLFEINLALSQITIVLDSINPSVCKSVRFRGNDNLELNYDSKSSIYVSKNLKSVCLYHSEKLTDTIATVSIYNQNGENTNSYSVPNYGNVVISDDGKLALFGNYYTEGIIFYTYLNLFDSRGKRIFNSEIPFGYSCYGEFTTDGDNYIYFVDSFGSDFMLRKYNLLIFDNSLKLIGKKCFNINQNANSLSFVELNEKNKFIILKMYSRNNRIEEYIKVDYFGNIIKN